MEQGHQKILADAAALGDRTGMFSDPHTGVALAVSIKLLKAGKKLTNPIRWSPSRPRTD